jgi:uncharacterized protein YggU (UPF0235/DUF167 family)
MTGPRFSVRLTPKGGRDAIEGWMRDAAGARWLKVRVAAPPEDGKANAALIRLLADALGVPQANIRIAGGAQARLKRIAVAGDTASLSARLDAYGDIA